MSLPVTLALFVAAMILFIVASILARRPTMPGQVRLIPLGLLQFIGLLIMLVMGAHLLSLMMGQPLTSRYFG
jgi:hypothetical protein